MRVTPDYSMFDCGGMAFSEANLKPFVRVCYSLPGEPHPYSAFWRFPVPLLVKALSSSF
jgi:hypothetical protein